MYTMKTKLALRGNYGAARSLSKIKFLVFHYTANDGDSDTGNANYFASRIVKASAHYFVDDDSVTQSVPDNYVAWSVGGSRYANYKQTGGGKFYRICTNTNSINVEMCDTQHDGKYNLSAKTRANAIALGRELMKKYHIDIDHVIRHFDVTGKACPVYFANNEAEWAKFKAELVGDKKKAVTPVPVQETVARGKAQHFSKTVSGTYTVTASSLNMRSYPGRLDDMPMCSLPRGTCFTCYGYYSVVGGRKWLYGVATHAGTVYQGFCTTEYLRR